MNCLTGRAALTSQRASSDSASSTPLAGTLVTSRLIGYDQARLDDRQFVAYRIAGFDDLRVAEYARKWFALEEGMKPGDEEQWADTFMDESANVADLRVNPLLLSLMCILYRGEGSLPRNRAQVYEQCASLMFRRWDTWRRIHLDLRAGYLLERTMRYLAWWLSPAIKSGPPLPNVS